MLGSMLGSPPMRRDPRLTYLERSRKEVNSKMHGYESPTLIRLGSFSENTGRFVVGFFSDGQGDYDWGPTKFSPTPQ